VTRDAVGGEAAGSELPNAADKIAPHAEAVAASVDFLMKTSD
jgi:hypothetical protein